MTWEPMLDNWIVLTGIFAAVACALVGNFMVLRRMSMMGDAISHAVLPGLAIAFLLTHSLGTLPMFVGAAVVGVLTAVFTQSIHHFGRVEQSAAMGVTFTTLFALGLLLIERATAGSVHLDAGCVLEGAIENVPMELFGSEMFMPTTTKVTLGMMIVNACFVAIFYKELRLSSFDPELATTVGINSQFMHYLLMTMMSVTVVATFEAVGSILVIAMLIVPPATARLLTDKLWVMIVLSAVLAAAAAALGHVGAIAIPEMFDHESVSTSGMMAVAAGLLLGLAMLFAPQQGVISRLIHRLRLGQRITREDILGMLFRLERGGQAVALPDMSQILRISGGAGPIGFRLALRSLANDGKIMRDGDKYQLTETGRTEARQIIRSHRLWEMYLHQFVNLPPEELHFPAEQLEHITDASMQDRLAATTDSPVLDPHGSDIPEKF